ncbi:MAG TPA: protein kinase, partial [Actinomycetota bacterium]|nr:protein kinase [Actinomycetota bacterium]
MLYAGRYEAIRRAGQGGQGTVWLARDVRDGRTIALKVGHDLSAVEVPPHPGLATVHEHLIHGDEHVVVMDWVQGTTLAEDRDLPFEECLRRVDEVAAALDHLHAHGLVHGDVKPANVVVARDGQAVLVDIGSGGSAATPGYRAPERERTPAADVFALAVTAAVLLTGAVPEPGAALDWSRVPAAQRDRVQSAIEAALATNPSQRPPSASALAALLRGESASHNLPEESTSFVGRVFAAAEVRRLLLTSPLVTVLGPGGAGKSRIGLHVARRALPAFRGVWLAELAAASQPDLVPGRVAAAVGASGSHAVDALAELFGEDEHLLVLDTC